MLASTSRSVLRSSLAAGKAPAFSTSAVRAKRGTVVVELLEEVPGLGKQYDRVQVTQGRMRHELAPFRLARWIPWKRASERMQAFVLRRERAIPSEHLQLDAPSDLDSELSANAREPEPVTPELLLNSLHLLPATLTFPLRTISSSTPALHGSLTLSDVQDVIARDHGLAGSDVEVVWQDQDAGARMKELGTWEAIVRVRGGGREEVPIQIEVVRQE